MRNVLGILVVAITSMILSQSCQKSEFLIISGIVTDSLTNKPIPGAYIFTQDGHVYTSASDGTFTITGIKPGKTNFQFGLRGYNPKSKSVIITDGRVNKINLTVSPILPPEIETGKITNITSNTAKVTGSIKLKSNVYISRYGHCWAYSTSLPSLEESIGRTSNVGGSGDISIESYLTGLQSDKIYYVRAYATTDAGITIYGNSVAFRTFDILIDEGLLLYFPFNGNYLDESGKGHSLLPDHGILPSFVKDRFGVNNSACHFSNLVDLYGSGNPVLNDFTVSLWFYKTNSWENEQEHLFQIGDSYNHDNIFYITQDIGPNNFNCGIRVNNSDYKLSLNSSPSLNIWHHVLAQRKGSELYLYIDGILKSNMNCPSDILPATYYFNIGAGWIGSGGPQYQQFYGDLDDIRLYDRALTISEIQYLRTH